MGLGVMDARHALERAVGASRISCGPRPTWCWRSARRMSIPYRGWGTDKNLTIIRIETDAEEMGRIERPTLGIVGDAQGERRRAARGAEAREGSGR